MKHDGQTTANPKIVTRLMFRLLPIQVLLAVVGSVNAIISSYFASNYIGIEAMSAVGLYAPINSLVFAASTMLAGGSAILCGRYVGRNEHDKVRNIFSLNLLLAALTAAVIIAAMLILGLFDLTGFFTRDGAVRPLFNRYLITQSLSILPLLLGNQMPNYLAMENRQNRTMAASLLYIATNLALNLLFLRALRMGIVGLSLASAMGLWVFFGVQAELFVRGKSHYRLGFRGLQWSESGQIVQIGLPGAASYGYQTLRGLIVNALLQLYIGSVAVSAFAAFDSVMRIFWAFLVGMVAVSRLMISLSVGEEDRQTLTDVMRVMFKGYLPVMCAVLVTIMLCAEPFTRLFFHDPTEPVYKMTIVGFRILPLCMPLSVITQHFVCYGQASGKRVLVNLLALLDGVACVAVFTALLIPWLMIKSVYIANILNGVVCCLVILGYACVRGRRFPRNMEELMVIPEDFGVSEDARLDISVRSVDEVVKVAEQVGAFCQRRGIDARRGFLASLCLEEMAGNIVAHGFTKDKKRHSIDIRVAHKGDDVILRIRDDCVPFDPQTRKAIFDPEDILKNVGIRMVYGIARDIDYQNIMGLNVLTIKI